MDEKYISGKGLLKNQWKDIYLQCELCNSQHLFRAKYKIQEIWNIEAYLINYEFLWKGTRKIAFNIENEVNEEKAETIINKIYLLLSFDHNPKLQEIKNNIKKKNSIDGNLFKNGLEIIKTIRNQLSHNKRGESSLHLHQYFLMIIEIANMLVNLSENYGNNLFIYNDKKMKGRKLILKKSANL